MKSFRATPNYDRLAPFYGVWTGLTETEAQQQALKVTDLKLGETVLEAAGDTAKLLTRIVQTPGLGQCVGVDRSSRMLEQGRRRLIPSFGHAGALCRSDARRPDAGPHRRQISRRVHSRRGS